MEHPASLEKRHTLGFCLRAAAYGELHHIKDLPYAIAYAKKVGSQPLRLLGEGSNVLFSRDYDGMVLKVALKGIQLLKERPSLCMDKGYEWRFMA